MSEVQDPTKPASNAEKFKPKNVAGDAVHGRAERSMHDVPRGSEETNRRSANNRVSDQG